MMSNVDGTTDEMYNIVLNIGLNIGLLVLPAIVLYNVKNVIGRILSIGRQGERECNDECECDLDCTECSVDSTDSTETVKPTLTQTTQTGEIDSGNESDSEDESEDDSDGINDIINKFKTDDDDIFMTELNAHIDTILKDLD